MSTAYARAIVLSLFLSSLSTLAQAQTLANPSCDPLDAQARCIPTPPTHTKISTLLYIYEQVLKTQGPSSALFGPLETPWPRSSPSAAGLGASLRFEAPLSWLDVLALEQLGLSFHHNALSQPALGSVYAAWIPFSALPQLERWPGLVRVEPAYNPILLRPLEVTGAQVGASAAHIHPNLSVTGKGVLIADIDSGIDVMHPAFFKADGGAFDWIDTNNNGKLDQGVDAIDYNRNGQVDLNERARILDASTVLDYASGELDNNDELLSASQDWVYLDANVDFKRNSGAAAGFLEDDPAYGEPLFVVEDANFNDRLDPYERLILLKTSKIVKYVDGPRVFERGKNLIEAGSAPGLNDAFHGTGVAGIAIGGQLGYHRRVGLAPDAELIMLSRDSMSQDPDWSADAELILLQEAVNSGADMVLHEWTNPFLRPLDGSTNLEAAMDAARAQGILQVNPLGNLNQAQKHIERELIPGQPMALSLEVGEGYPYGDQVYPYTVVYASLQWQGIQRPNVTMISPSGQRVTVPTTPQNEGAFVEDAIINATYETTPRQNTLLTIFLYSQDNRASLAQGQWTIELDDITTPARLIGRASDYFSSWGKGIGWVEHSPDLRSLCFPATADSSIGVAAYAGRHEAPEDGSVQGQLRGYSGRGPRLDGRRAVDITAPDDPYAPIPASPDFIRAGYGKSWFGTFGGTSGAGPHVAAAFALLMEQDPEADADALETRLFEAANQEGLSPTPAEQLPDDSWGYGKLDVYMALYGEPQRSNRPPQALVVASWKPSEGLTLDASMSSDPDDDELQARFDFDHDGTFDTPWQDELIASTDDPAHLSALLAHQHGVARVELRDALGARHGALLVIEPKDDKADMGPAADMNQAPDLTEQPQPQPRAQDPGCATSSSPRASSPLSLLSLLWAAIALVGARRRRRRKL